MLQRIYILFDFKMTSRQKLDRFSDVFKIKSTNNWWHYTSAHEIISFYDYEVKKEPSACVEGMHNYYIEVNINELCNFLILGFVSKINRNIINKDEEVYQLI